MKIGSILPCGAAALLFLSACGGGEKPAPGAPAQTPAQKPAQTPTPAAQNPAPVAAKPPAPVRIDYEMVKRLFGMEPAAPAVDNPGTPEKVALGRQLFHEQHLSKDGKQSCASCHDLAKYGQDGLPTSPGGERNAPTVWNASRQFAQLWDYRAGTVEDVVLVPGHGPLALGLADEAAVTGKLKEKPELAAAFQKAFPGEADAVTAGNFKLALGAFLRTLVTKSKFDAYLDGDQKALSNEEKLGLKTFVDTGCIQCHMTRLLGGNMPQKLGVLKPYPSHDPGRAGVTKSDADKSLFKVPSLLNVEKTAPYNHDGKFASLADAVANMADIQLGRQLKPEETAAIVAFLKALTGPLPQAQ